MAKTVTVDWAVVANVLEDRGRAQPMDQGDPAVTAKVILIELANALRHGFVEQAPPRIKVLDTAE